MKGRSLLALPVLAFAFACEGDRSPTGPKSVPFDPSDVIQDGAHGGNPDFWFLPPLVPFPRHQDFVLGTFNDAIRPSLRIEICELRNERLSALGIPTGGPDGTRCKAHATDPDKFADPIKTFPAGTVNLVRLPRRQFGWWSFFGLPADGFYYVLWNTRQSPRLDRSKFYRITVMIKARESDPAVVLGIADVDPMPNLREWRHARTGEVVQMIDGILLPIPFRVEDGALCEPGTTCTSVTVTNNDDGVDQIVPYEPTPGVVTAGASIPDCVLPGPDCPLPDGTPAPADAIQSFVLNISQVITGGSGFASNAANTNAQSAPTVCHPPPFPLQQFEGCFNFTTTPTLPAINEAGDVFLNAVTVAVCFELVGNTTDPRVPFVRLFASDPGEEPRLLPQASDIGILTTPSARDCTFTGASNSTGVMGLASAGWRKLQGGFGRLFGVKTAYALDAGIAGLVKRISNVGPALVAEIVSNSSDDDVTVEPGVATPFSARILGVSHDEDHPSTGLANMPVDFSLSECQGDLVGPAISSVTEMTNADGVAQVSLTVASGSCTLTATGQAFGEVTFEATAVAQLLPDLVISSGAPVITPPTVISSGGTVLFSPWTIQNQGGAFLLGGNLVENGFFLSTDPVITAGDTYLNDNNFNSTEIQGAGAFFNWGAPTFTIPARAPGVYYVGILVDRANVVAESDETNNYASQALTVVEPFLERPWDPTERRMLSMQTGATYQIGVFSPNVVASWLSSNPTNVTVSETGLVTALVGGESIEGGADASITSTLAPTGSPGPNALVNSFSFNLFPRITTLAWNAVAGAVSYQVVTEFGFTSPGGCAVPAACAIWAPHTTGSTWTRGTPARTYTFAFVGSQPGRWKVFARNAAGTVINESAFVYFDYDI